MDNNLFYEVAEGIRFFHFYDKFDRKAICFKIIQFAKTMKIKVDVPLLLSLIHENHPKTNDIAFIKVIKLIIINLNLYKSISFPRLFMTQPAHNAIE